MLPKEHGAYGQLLFPLLTAVAMGHPTVASAALIMTATAAFLAHEPLLVLAGARGPRARRDEGARAWRWLGTLAGLAAVAGSTAWLTMDPALRWTLLVPVVAAAFALVWSARGLERTTWGEIAAGVALSAAAFPVGVTAGLSIPASSGCVVAFATGTITATLSVRALIGRVRSSDAPGLRTVFALSAALIVLDAWLAWAGVIHRAGFWGGLPVTLVALAIVALAPPPKFLRRVGWSLVAATAVAALVLVVSGHLQ